MKAIQLTGTAFGASDRRAFKVRGANATTGDDVTITVNAADAAEAEAKAHSAGIFVSGVTPVDSPINVSPKRAAKSGLNQQFLTRLLPTHRRKVLTAFVGVIVLTPALIVWMNIKDSLFLDRRGVESSSAQNPVGISSKHNGLGKGTLAGDSRDLRRNHADLQAMFSGTFATSADAKTDMSITFRHPTYLLNPSRSFVWTAGTRGTWDLFSDHPALTDRQRNDGWYILTMTPPDDPAAPVPAHVKFDIDTSGRVTAVRFASFMGMQFPAAQHVVLYRKDDAISDVSTVPEAQIQPPVVRRTEMSGERCLICRSFRSATALASYSDRAGRGLCDECGREYRAWERILPSIQAGFPPSATEQESMEQFKQTLERNFSRYDEDGRRGIGLIFLMGKFGSSEWDALTGGNQSSLR